MHPDELRVLGREMLTVSVVVDSLLSVAIDYLKSQPVHALPGDELLAHVLFPRVHPRHRVTPVMRVYMRIFLQSYLRAPWLRCRLLHDVMPNFVLLFGSRERERAKGP